MWTWWGGPVDRVFIEVREWKLSLTLVQRAAGEWRREREDRTCSKAGSIAKYAVSTVGSMLRVLVSSLQPSMLRVVCPRHMNRKDG